MGTLQVGCGVGNTAFPLLEVNPQARVYACDFSATAIQCVQQHGLYASGRITAFVADVTSDRLSAHIPPATVDICTMVFVLSAISPQRMKQAGTDLSISFQVFFRLNLHCSFAKVCASASVANPLPGSYVHALSMLPAHACMRLFRRSAMWRRC